MKGRRCDSSTLARETHFFSVHGILHAMTHAFGWKAPRACVPPDCVFRNLVCDVESFGWQIGGISVATSNVCEHVPMCVFFFLVLGHDSSSLLSESVSPLPVTTSYCVRLWSTENQLSIASFPGARIAKTISVLYLLCICVRSAKKGPRNIFAPSGACIVRASTLVSDHLATDYFGDHAHQISLLSWHLIESYWVYLYMNDTSQ